MDTLYSRNSQYGDAFHEVLFAATKEWEERWVFGDRNMSLRVISLSCGCAEKIKKKIRPVAAVGCASNKERGDPELCAEVTKNLHRLAMTGKRKESRSSPGFSQMPVKRLTRREFLEQMKDAAVGSHFSMECRWHRGERLLRSVGTLRFEPLASWSDGGPENVRSLTIHKDQINLSAPFMSPASWQYAQYKVKSAYLGKRQKTLQSVVTFYRDSEGQLHRQFITILADHTADDHHTVITVTRAEPSGSCKVCPQ
ncbi:hypothetical protein PoB_007636200 [Plakobranchus ocellatus]|uniref:Uncharacterized protein n=1 Tax=Plakobranchus ocellatus TaxID=259542 RepID=A0AAV4DZV2_9GAST|nr:hypothetical protein PoB_007636200 [Plakobranchus ocellatus]